MVSSLLQPGDDWILISQGAEAKVWKIPNYIRDNGTKMVAIAKERFHKAYRHPVLDERLTKQRCRAEARILEKCAKKGTVVVPNVLHVDPPVLYLEYIAGATVRDCLETMLHGGQSKYEDVLKIGALIGRTVGSIHALGICHGDLTTSNMMIRNESFDQLIMIDFGLAKNTESAEERAVDLYVLERTLTSTHPLLPAHFLEHILDHYEKSATKSKVTLSRLEKVRMRGRKRECLG